MIGIAGRVGQPAAEILVPLHKIDAVIRPAAPQQMKRQQGTAEACADNGNAPTAPITDSCHEFYPMLEND
jgi:hypothetical protein